MYPKILQKFDNFLVQVVNRYANYRWYSSPLAKNVKANKNTYLEFWKQAKEKQYKILL